MVKNGINISIEKFSNKIEYNVDDKKLILLNTSMTIEEIVNNDIKNCKKTFKMKQLLSR